MSKIDLDKDNIQPLGNAVLIELIDADLPMGKTLLMNPSDNPSQLAIGFIRGIGKDVSLELKKGDVVVLKDRTELTGREIVTGLSPFYLIDAKELIAVISSTPLD